MADSDLYVDDDMLKTDIVDFVKDNRDEITSLQEVSLSQNKQPLIESVNDALEEHLEDLQEPDGEEIQFGDEGEEASEDAFFGERGQASAPPFQRD
jgi:hypothetical protein